MERMCFVNDDDGHWYLIPAKDKDKFDTAMEEYDDDLINNDFGGMRLNRHISFYTFTDPKER